MKSDIKLIAAASLMALLTCGVPVGLNWAKERQTQALLSRPTAGATHELRRAIASCTEIYVWLGIDEKCRPYTAGPTSNITPGKFFKHSFVLRGHEAQSLIAAIHAEGHAPSAWRPAAQPYRGIMHDVTVMDFYAGERWLGELRFFRGYLGVEDLNPGGYVRWYTPVKYRGDSNLLPESRRYLDQVIESKTK